MKEFSHGCNVPPWQVGCQLQRFFIKPADRLTTFDEANPNSIEDQPVSQRPSQKVPVDLIEGKPDVEEALTGVSTHSGIASIAT